MGNAERRGPRQSRTSETATDARLLSDVVSGMRRALRTSMRTDFPWETLPMAQVEILQRLDEEPGLRLNEVAARQRLAKNTVSTVVQRMVDAGLLSRSVDQADRRAVHLSLTSLGRNVLDGWKEAHESRLQEALHMLAPGDQRAIARSLPSLAKLVDELMRQDARPHVVGARARSLPRAEAETEHVGAG